jgi:hypothetical protein
MVLVAGKGHYAKKPLLPPFATARRGGVATRRGEAGQRLRRKAVAQGEAAAQGSGEAEAEAVRRKELLRGQR